MHDQSSRAFGGTSLQLGTSEKTDGVQSLYNGILVNLQESADFVEHLINRNQTVAAVKFSFAYDLDDKDHLVDMLRKYVKNAKLICESSCKKSNSIGIKDKARDEEIASLGTVLQCISDSNLESTGLLHADIEYRILELKAHKGY
ncbi:hypothetical protein MtrunA17_Chr2g0325271 [Medicago truncatula]|nr:hypothetical protein MtrunA17_Chr2g0325271 [Medicago truncatula]